MHGRLCGTAHTFLFFMPPPSGLLYSGRYHTCQLREWYRQSSAHHLPRSQVWVSPEQHGSVTAAFKNQIDWIPLELGSVRPTQGRVVAIAQVPVRACGLGGLGARAC